MKKVFLSALMLIFVASCSQTPIQEPESSENGTSLQGDTIQIMPSSPIGKEISTLEIQEESKPYEFSVSGEITPLPSAYAEVGVPFPGRVQRSLVTLGQKVQAGAPLFELQSSAYSEVVKNYLQAKASYEVAQKSISRIRDLHANKVSSDKDLEEAEANYNLQLQEYKHAQAVAKEFQVPLQQAQVGQPMVVRSPISGTVIANNLVRGEYLKEDVDAKVIVANLSQVWVKANISEKEASLLEDISEVEVRPVSRPHDVVKGKVIYSGGILDPETRTIQTVILCNNPKGHMLPNMYATVMFSTTMDHCIQVPKSAVFQSQEQRYVYLKVGKDSYVRHPVSVQGGSSDNIIITDGLQQGDVIISQGGYLLNDIQ